MIKSSRKINNIVKGFLFLGSCVGASAFVWANPMDECAEEEYSSSVNLETGTVQRAQKIVTLALFDAIDQGSLKGVTFLIERGADPKAENKRGRTPLDLAEHLAEKHPDEQVYRKIADSLRDWDSEQYAVDDETIVNTARQISGLNGGDKVGPIKKVLQGVFKSSVEGAGTGAAIQGIQEATGEKKDGSVKRIMKQAVAGACEGVAGDAARHGVQKVAGKVPGAVAEGTAIGATRCAMDNSGGIIQDLWGRRYSGYCGRCDKGSSCDGRYTWRNGRRDSWQNP